MPKVIPISPDSFYGSRIFILGSDVVSEWLLQRIVKGLIDDPDEKVKDYSLSHGDFIPFGEKIDQLIVISDELTTEEISRKYSDFKTLHFTTREAYSYTKSQKKLNESDWQSLRDIERLMLMIDSKGLIELPEDIRQRFLEREKHRCSVDSEIGITL